MVSDPAAQLSRIELCLTTTLLKPLKTQKHSQVDVIFTNFAIAFNRVTIIFILHKSGFGKPVLSWFKSYTYQADQWVKVFGNKSNVIEIPSGVPRGGHLFPLIY